MMQAMRTTVDLPADLHDIVSSLATHGRRSFSKTATELIRRGLNASSSQGARKPVLEVSAITGLPLLRGLRPMTPEDVKALDDEL